MMSPLVGSLCTFALYSSMPEQLILNGQICTDDCIFANGHVVEEGGTCDLWCMFSCVPRLYQYLPALFDLCMVGTQHTTMQT